jgi:hypothetical protein
MTDDDERILAPCRRSGDVANVDHGKGWPSTGVPSESKLGITVRHVNVDGGLVPSAATVRGCSVRVLVVADARVLLRHDLPLFTVSTVGTDNQHKAVIQLVPR